MGSRDGGSTRTSSCRSGLAAPCQICSAIVPLSQAQPLDSDSGGSSPSTAATAATVATFRYPITRTPRMAQYSGMLNRERMFLFRVPTEHNMRRDDSLVIA